jgi:hypothetical protein
MWSSQLKHNPSHFYKEMSGKAKVSFSSFNLLRYNEWFLPFTEQQEQFKKTRKTDEFAKIFSSGRECRMGFFGASLAHQQCDASKDPFGNWLICKKV